MRHSLLVVIFLALPNAYAGYFEDELFELIEARKDPKQRDNAQLKRIAFLLSKADLTARNSRHDSPIHLVAAYGDDPVARLIVARNPDLEQRNLSEQTPLLAAIANRCYTTALIFILQGDANTWVCDCDGAYATDLIKTALPTLSGALLEDATTLLSVLEAPRHLPHCSPVTLQTEPRPSYVRWAASCVAGLTAVAVVTLFVTKNSGDSAQ